MFTLTMTTDGAAFTDPQVEISRILAKLQGTVTDSAADWAALVTPFSVSGPLHDSNGNRVGSWTFEPATDNLPGPTTFSDLAIGDTFHFGRNPESGLLADMDRPGRRTYTKVSTRKWTEPEYGTGRVGSVSACVWPA